MTLDNETPSPAGESNSAPESLSMSAAAAMMSQAEENASEAERPADQPEPPTDNETPAGDEPVAPEGEPENQDEPPQGEQETPPEDPEPLDFDRLNGNTKLRLRDGREVTVGTLKKQWAEFQELSAKQQDFEAKQQQFQQFAAQSAQQAQFFEQMAPRAIAALQAQLPEVPPMPPAELLKTDFYEYQVQKDAHDRGLAARFAKEQEIQQLEQAHQYQVQQREQENWQRTEAYLAQQRERLLEEMPDLRDPVKAKAFAAEFVEHGKHYGFTEQELSGVNDSRLMPLVRDAIAYRKLMAAKPKPAPKQQTATAPVAAPGRRVSAPEARSERKEELLQRANKPGGMSLREAASLMSQIEKD